MYQNREDEVAGTVILILHEYRFRFMFRTAERIFTTAECTFTIAECTFRSAEYKPNALSYPIRTGCIQKSVEPSFPTINRRSGR
ncbi:MAG: hypothetical protein MR802_00455 [Prevotella sp.]|nr:hypothetical protein [Prevotella sp.]